MIGFGVMIFTLGSVESGIILLSSDGRKDILMCGFQGPLVQEQSEPLGLRMLKRNCVGIL